MKHNIRHKAKKMWEKRPRRKKGVEASMEQAIQSIPRITNETVAEHREAVLGSARKYIYPLQHSAHRVVIISATLLTVAVVGFFTYVLLALYKFQNTSSFIYAVTQVIPFPVAKAGPHVISYENYLFELRHYMHYYETQQKVDFKSESGKAQLADFKKRSLDDVITDAYVKQLASDKKIKITKAEMDQQVALLREQNRLGSNDQVFADVLRDFWGWSVDDFKRKLEQQMLAQKLVATLDTDARQRAQNALAKIKQGVPFADVAKEFSDDQTTKESGGDYGVALGRSTRDVPPPVIDALFKLNQGEVSGIINAGNFLEIVTLKGIEGDKRQAAHIAIMFKPISTYIDPLRAKDKPRFLISTPE